MADLALVTANRVRCVESFEQMTLPTDEAIVAGQAVRLNTLTGQFTKAKGTDVAENRIYGIALHTVVAGMPVTAVRKGVIDGFNLDACAYDLAIYLSDTDGMLGSAAADSTTTLIIGRVIPATSNLIGGSFDKLLFVDL